MADLTYEMILMLDPDVGDEPRAKLAEDVKSKLAASGEILNEDHWGMRKMAYLIEKKESSDYWFFRFNGGQALLDDLNHSLKITDGILRFRIFKTDADAPVMVPPDTEQIMRRDEDDRGRGRGGDRDRGDRGPRRPRYEDESPSPPPAAEPTPEPAAEPTPEPAGEPEPAAAAAPEAE